MVAPVTQWMEVVLVNYSPKSLMVLYNKLLQEGLLYKSPYIILIKGCDVPN